MTFKEFENMFEDDPTIKCYEWSKDQYVLELYNDTFTEKDSIMFSALELGAMRDPYNYIQGLINHRYMKYLNKNY